MTPEAKKAIEKEAEELYPFEKASHFVANSEQQLRRDAHIKACTLWIRKLESLRDSINAENEEDQYLRMDVAVYENDDGTIVDVSGKNYIEVERVLSIIGKHLKP